ncbi:MAG: hypothetical protein Q9209_007336 [Squamulea sp. 1 TL-2023]
MSFTKTKTTNLRRPSLTVLSTSLQTSQEQMEEVELTNITPSTYMLAHTHQPQPPSPLITFAPNSPALSSVELTPTDASPYGDLTSTMRPLPALPYPRPAPPIASILPTPHIDYPAEASSRRIAQYDDLEAGHLAKYDDDEDLEACMPAGWPYRNWRGYAWLTLEWVQNMQSLLMNLMEQEHRLGGARHTI